jgi:hypothetical protein
MYRDEPNEKGAGRPFFTNLAAPTSFCRERSARNSGPSVVSTVPVDNFVEKVGRISLSLHRLWPVFKL